MNTIVYKNLEPPERVDYVFQAMETTVPLQVHESAGWAFENMGFENGAFQGSVDPEEDVDLIENPKAKVQTGNQGNVTPIDMSSLLSPGALALGIPGAAGPLATAAVDAGILAGMQTVPAPIVIEKPFPWWLLLVGLGAGYAISKWGK